jgi:cell division protein FtsX
VVVSVMSVMSVVSVVSVISVVNVIKSKTNKRNNLQQRVYIVRSLRFFEHKYHFHYPKTQNIRSREKTTPSTKQKKITPTYISHIQ